MNRVVVFINIFNLYHQIQYVVMITVFSLVFFFFNFSCTIEVINVIFFFFASVLS